MTASTEIAKSMGGLNALEEARDHLAVALMQTHRIDDQITLGHIQKAHMLLQIVTRTQRLIQSSDGGVEGHAEPASSTACYGANHSSPGMLEGEAGIKPCPSEAIDLPPFPFTKADSQR